MKDVIGAEAVAAALAAEKVDTVFGIPDGTYLGLLASLEKYEIRLITPRHETSAAHMAGAYSRLTGKLGVCIASNGPGVANILPGVAVENAEGNRVLLITSCRRQGLAYPDRGGSYQCFDQVGVIKPMTKWSGFASTFERVPEMMRQAMRKSFSGRPGVVHVDIPENVLNGKFEVADDALVARVPDSYRRTHVTTPPADQVQAVAKILRDAKLPLLHAGSGVLHAGAHEELAEVARLLRAPVITSWAARAALADDDPHSIPMIAMDVTRNARNQADAIVVLGSRIGETDWWGRGRHWRTEGERSMIQVDIDEDVLGVNVQTDVAILADVKVFLHDLAAVLRDDPPTEERLQARLSAVAALREDVGKLRGQLRGALDTDTDPMHPAHVPNACRQFFGDDAVLVIDGGNTALWTTFFHEVRATNSVLSTFKMGMLGAGVGQALGAKAAMPDRQVYCILGDGAMGFHPQELETAVRHGLNVTYLVCCDRQWGMVKLTQQFMLGDIRSVMGVDGSDTINTDLSEIRFDDLARSMGAHGERVSKPSDLRPALERCAASGLPSVVHVDVDQMQTLWAPGLQEFKEMHQEPV